MSLCSTLRMPLEVIDALVKSNQRQLICLPLPPTKKEKRKRKAKNITKSLLLVSRAAAGPKAAIITARANIVTPPTANSRKGLRAEHSITRVRRLPTFKRQSRNGQSVPVRSAAGKWKEKKNCNVNLLPVYNYSTCPPFQQRSK